MTATDQVFLDTSPIIYLIENNVLFYPKVSSFLANVIDKDGTLSTSVISIAEFGVKPKRLNKPMLIDEMEEMLEILQVKIIDINREIAELSSSIRANYPSLKNLDALQLASAISSNCTDFLTNDKKLKIVTEINVLVVDELH
jgi:predicted nucleic acid-binding protein